MRFKAPIIILVTLMVPAYSIAQLNHFIYLQTEGKQPFYARIDKKIFSSSVSGHLIIPKLKDGTCNITIGFPKRETEENTYTYIVNNKDAGFLIKKFGEKGWGLFNFQTLDVVMATDSKPGLVKSQGIEKTDEFSSMLSEVVNDPSIKQQEKPVVNEKETPIAKQVDKKETPISFKSIIIQKKSITTVDGIERVYIDISGDKQDTVSILIPDESQNNRSSTTPIKAVKDYQEEINEKNSAEEIKESVIEKKIDTNTKQTQTPVDEVKYEKGKEDKKFLPIELKTMDSSDVNEEGSKVTTMINSDCKVYASDDDFLKLRKKMASQNSEDDMISVAKKFFKAKCYTTGQVKNLSLLFLTEAGKYRFFDIAYAFVSDSHNFSSLEDQFKDTYFIARFKAMVRH